MKYILNISSILVMLMLSLSSSAQSTLKLRDLIRQQEGLAAAKVASVEIRAIIPELSVVRQQYRLEQNGDYYGKNNKSFYGESYSLAVKISGGTLFLADVVEPWKYDTDYARDNASGNYKPALFWTYQRPIDEATYKTVNLEILGSSDFVKPMNEEKSLYLHTDAISDFGLSIDNAEGSKQGYMIWAYSKTNVQDSAMVVDLLPSPFAIEAKADSTLIQMAPSAHEKIIGGVYVTPKIEKGGRVQYMLSGIAVRNGIEGWSLQLLCTGDTITSSSSQITKTDEPKKGRTNKKSK